MFTSRLVTLLGLVGVLLGLGAWHPLRAQDAPPVVPIAAPAPTPSQALLLAELDKRRPDENSPFFALREQARFYNTEAGRQLADANRVAVYPNTAGNETVSHQVGQFVRGLTRSFRFWSEKPQRMTELEVIPGAIFSLEDRREISATLTVTNHSNRLLSLEFPTAQRFDFVITDAAGGEVARWSQDRNFPAVEGVVMINPQERITYTATLPTRDLVAGNTYQLTASLAGHPQFTHSVVLEPR